jgi:hypothetical protein
MQARHRFAWRQQQARRQAVLRCRHASPAATTGVPDNAGTAGSGIGVTRPSIRRQDVTPRFGKRGVVGLQEAAHFNRLVVVDALDPHRRAPAAGRIGLGYACDSSICRSASAETRMVTFVSRGSFLKIGPSKSMYSATLPSGLRGIALTAPRLRYPRQRRQCCCASLPHDVR